jgi:hypothetical protein
MLKIIDNRWITRRSLVLADLKANDTFVWAGEDEPGLEKGAPHRVLHMNSNYLGCTNRHAPDRLFVLNMVTGKIHHRHMRTEVRRIDVQINVFEQGHLSRGVTL